MPRLYPRILTQLCPRTLSRLCPRPTLWSYLCSSLSCSWPVRYHPHPTSPHPFVWSILKSVLLLTLSSPPHPTPPFGLIYAQVCLAPDLCFIIPTPPHPCRYNWAQILDFVGTSETNTCRYKWVKSVGASEPLPSTYLTLLNNVITSHQRTRFFRMPNCVQSALCNWYGH